MERIARVRDKMRSLRNIRPFVFVFPIVMMSQTLHAQSLRLVREIGQIEGSENYTFHRIGGIAVARDGTLFVVDSGDQKVKVYSRTGEFTGSFGRQGSGPGEFMLPGRIELRGDTVIVFDVRQSRVIRFTHQGEQLRTESLPSPDGLALADFRPMRFGHAVGTSIFRAALGADTEHDPDLRLLLLRDGSGPVDTLATFQAAAAIWFDADGQKSWGVTGTTFGVGVAFALDGDSIIAIADGMTGVVRWFSVQADGLDTLRTADLGISGSPITPRDRVELEDSLRARNRTLPRRLGFHLPTMRSALSGQALFDDRGGLWIELNRAAPLVVTWLRIDGGGQIRRFEIPRQLAIRAVVSDTIYGVWTGPLDVQTVRVFALELARRTDDHRR